jgi:hypothetical protein
MMPTATGNVVARRMPEPNQRQIRSELQISPGATSPELADRIHKQA